MEYQGGIHMFSVAVCDDNSYDLSTMTAYLSELRPSGINAEVTTYSSGAELAAAYKKGRRFHCIILDMLMTPLDGISTAKEIRKYDVHVPILIVTSTVQYALEGYQVDAWRYLVKPVDKQVFIKEIAGIYRELSLEKPNYFIVSNSSGVHQVRYTDIMYFESNMHMIRLRTLDSEHTFRGSISDIEQRMEPHRFLRVHKSFVVNLGRIKSIYKNSLLMQNGDEVPLSKHRSARLYEAMLDFAGNGYDG